MVRKSPEAYRNIRETSQILGLEPHVLRFWESRFPEISPMTLGGKRRYYSPDDIALLKLIKTLLHERGVTIKAASRLITEHGMDALDHIGANDSTQGEDLGEPSFEAETEGAVEAQGESAKALAASARKKDEGVAREFAAYLKEKADAKPILGGVQNVESAPGAPSEARDTQTVSQEVMSGEVLVAKEAAVDLDIDDMKAEDQSEAAPAGEALMSDARKDAKKDARKDEGKGELAPPDQEGEAEAVHIAQADLLSEHKESFGEGDDHERNLELYLRLNEIDHALVMCAHNIRAAIMRIEAKMD